MIITTYNKVPGWRNGGDSTVEKTETGERYRPKKIIPNPPKWLVAVAFVTGRVPISNHSRDTKVFWVFRIFDSHSQKPTRQYLSYVMTPSFQILTSPYQSIINHKLKPHTLSCWHSRTIGKKITPFKFLGAFAGIKKTNGIFVDLYQERKNRLYRWRIRSVYLTSSVHGVTAAVGQGVLITEAAWSHSAGLLWMSDQAVTDTSTWQHTTLTSDRCAPGGIRTRNPSQQAAADTRIRPRGHWDRLYVLNLYCCMGAKLGKWLLK